MTQTDIRDDLFAGVAHRTVTAAVVVEAPGIVTEVGTAARTARELGLTVERAVGEGQAVQAGDEILRLSGGPGRIALAEERLIGLMAKPSGIATAARRFVERAGGRPRIVSGAWKKLPYANKDMIRSAVTAGGAEPRIAAWPFIYLDKNFVTMLGGVGDALAATAGMGDLRRIVQLGDGPRTIAENARTAAESGADVVFVDTGRHEDIVLASRALHDRGLRDRVELAFGGGVRLDDIGTLRQLDVDTLDVGRAIVDAPLLDMSLRVRHITEG